MSRHSSVQLSLVEAIETLSNIADLEFEGEIGIAQKHEVILDHYKIDYKTVHWLHQSDAKKTVGLVRETFRVILHYLRQFYDKEYRCVVEDKLVIEKMKTLMLLVGEAAKKLDKYNYLFKKNTKSVTASKEYKQLEEFYSSRIAPQVDEGTLSKWILGLELYKHSRLKSLPASASKETKRVFVDLETVKKDTEYELFFIRKENGTRFFSPRLLRNMKLVCDFGNYFTATSVADPLENVHHWVDRSYQLAARQLIKSLGSRLQQFGSTINQFKAHEVIQFLNKAILALMLSSHPQNLLRHRPIKTCEEYFIDFQIFLRGAIQTRTYQKWLVHPPKASNHMAMDVLEFTQLLCRLIYTHLQGTKEQSHVIEDLMQSSLHSLQRQEMHHHLWHHLTVRYDAFSKQLKNHPYGPLFKVLDFLENHGVYTFDPLVQENIPYQLFDIYLDDNRLNHVRLASPTHQEFIQKAFICEEFKAFLRNYKHSQKRHLFINLQDRTSWREHARCIALEELQHDKDVGDALCVVTLTKDTDFYHQLPPYHETHHAQLFFEHFKEHLTGEGFGFYFPPFFNRAQLTDFVENILPLIHRLFFFEKNILTREQRLDFIEIFYLFLELKLIEWVKPDSFSLTCKDSVDQGPLASVQLAAFLMLLNQPDWTEKELKNLDQVQYAAPLLIRERAPLNESFNRMTNSLRTIESVVDQIGATSFGSIVKKACAPFYTSDILDANPLF